MSMFSSQCTTIIICKTVGGYPSSLCLNLAGILHCSSNINPPTNNTNQHLHYCHSIVSLLIQCQLIMIRKLLILHYFMSEHNEKCVSRKIKYEIK